MSHLEGFPIEDETRSPVSDDGRVLEVAISSRRVVLRQAVVRVVESICGACCYPALHIVSTREYIHPYKLWHGVDCCRIGPSYNR